MDKKDEKALEEKSKIQKDAEGTLPGRQLGSLRSTFVMDEVKHDYGIHI